jgi:thiol-disulfide isomerase/thioredoxin
MRRTHIFLYFAVACFSSNISFAQTCAPTNSTEKILEQLQAPENMHLSAAERKEAKLQLLRRALAASPSDVFLNEAYQDASLAGMEVNRPALVAEYESLLQKHPNDPTFMYLAASAEAGRQTKQAMLNAERAIERNPNFGLSHLLLARIYSSHAYEDNTQMNRHLEKFIELCPGSVRALPNLAWSKDKELIKHEAARLRRNVEARRDSEAVAAYPTVWNFEAALERSDQQSENQASIRHDLERLQGNQFARNSAWLEAIESSRFFDGIPDDVRPKAQHEIAVLYPNSDAALREQYKNAVSNIPCPANGTAEQNSICSRLIWPAILPLLHQWPSVPWLASRAAGAVIEDRTATNEQVIEVIGLFQHAVEQDPDAFQTLPPQSTWIAYLLVERGGPFDPVPQLATVGFAATEREHGPDSVNDLDGAASNQLLQMWYLIGYVPLAEADLKLGRISDGEGALSQAEIRLQTIRPSETASSSDKARFADLAAPYWYVRGMYAEKQNRKMDALVDYRNALVLFPPRGPSPDRRDEVMASAQRVWKELGGTTAGWNDWATQSSLASFYAGSGGSETWSKVADANPDLRFDDALGNHWNPRDLAKKTTFITIWASWCAPCRAELPYLEKLYQRFKTRDDVAILAFNVDDDPKAMTTALQELKLSIPSVAARDFAYSVVPEMGLPANWVISPKKTEWLENSANSQDAWLENVAKAIDKSSAKQ